eukprot:CAMPEP_0174244326 /NCGR_PEP_ID=MMETSP0417-20130205/34914_1 /TAXON_ID=242541 /ORGANISM="Mayorella sp, Strain BSH-02190019" /LENGTH=430 /DNA_ID=CAMNT_0015323999 /DNA_START=58 /DNA_END=1350 /DNA_ORIENTATION=+
MAAASSPSTTDFRSQRVRQFGDSVWAEFADLVTKYKPINLGQGFPNFSSPEFCKEAAAAAIAQNYNQYARTQGHERLCQALSDTFTPLLKRETPICPKTETMVTVGACESLYLAMQAFVDPGDEVILIEPFFDFYRAQIELAGGVVKSVPLRNKHLGATDPAHVKTSADFEVDWKELEAAISDRTKMCIVNTPHNPTGKVFSLDELERFAALAKKHDFLVISDEVYEWMIFDTDRNQHHRMATLDDMWQRTLTIGSGGKTFSVTGWKIGWTIADAKLIKAMWTIHQYVAYTVCTPLQEAVAVSFEKAATNGYFEEYRQSLEVKRDRLAAMIREAGLDPIIPQGSYFMMIDTSAITLPEEDKDESRPRDFAVAKYLTRKAGVLGIPPSAFYSEPNKTLADNLLRVCFCKTDDVLDAAGKNLKEKLDLSSKQ